MPSLSPAPQRPRHLTATTATAATIGMLAVALALVLTPFVAARVITDADGGNFRPNLNQNSKAVVDNCAYTYIILANDTCTSIASTAGI
ncbi:hypothetical protein HK405_008994, partial [Cladochytrium tenue]